MKILSIFRNVKSRYKILQNIERHEALLDQVKKDKIKNIKNPAEYARLWSIEKDYQRNLEILKELL